MSLDRALVVALVVFAGSVGTLALVGMVLALIQLAADTAGHIAAAGIGASVSVPLARARKGK